MFSRIRKRFTYANVAMTFALVFAMSGGAYAASKYVITSTKQISPKVLKSLKGANGANGANGPNGAQGPQGPQGNAGANGEKGGQGEPGKAGESVTTAKAGGSECKEGGTKFTVAGKSEHLCNGEKGVLHPKETLPSGATETGSWSLTGQLKVPVVSLSFAIPLVGKQCEVSSGPPPVFAEQGLCAAQVHYIAGSGTGECPGTAAKPEATPGNLCVYQGSAFNVGPVSIINPSSSVFAPALGAATSGAIANLEPANPAEEQLAWGTWAVTE